LLDLLTHPEDKPKAQRISEVDIGQHPEGHIPYLSQVPAYYSLGDDRDNLPTRRDNFGIGTGERAQLESTIVAPRPAIEADHERTFGDERGHLDQLAVAIGHEEIRHLLPDRWNHGVGAVSLDALDELVVSRFEVGKQLA
jgi:hypothetical protein